MRGLSLINDEFNRILLDDFKFLLSQPNEIRQDLSEIQLHLCAPMLWEVFVPALHQSHEAS